MADHFSIPPDDFLAKKLSIFSELGAAEYDFLHRLQRNDRDLEAGASLLVEGEPVSYSFVLKDGWGARYKLLEDGRRQILSFILPGDIIGASGCFVQAAQQSVVTITEATVAAFKPQRLLTLSRKHPRLGAALAWSTAREESMLAERLVSLGRRSAYEAIAHLFLELSHRLRAIGLAGTKSFELPITQTDLGDALGLTVVHVNRTLKRLRKDGLIELSDGIVRILDGDKLAEVPAFRGRYLLHQTPPKATQAYLQDLTKE